MEGPFLILKSWLLTAVVIWVYKRWFQRVAPPSPGFEAFCKAGPVVGAIWNVAGHEPHVVAALVRRLGKASASVATLGGYPWPHYRLALRVESRQSAVLLRVVGAQVVRTKDGTLPALAHVLRDVLSELPAPAEAWLHSGAFNNGLVAPPAGGWSIERGQERRPTLTALVERPDCLCSCSLPGATAPLVGQDRADSPQLGPFGAAGIGLAVRLHPDQDAGHAQSGGARAHAQ